MIMLSFQVKVLIGVITVLCSASVWSAEIKEAQAGKSATPQEVPLSATVTVAGTMNDNQKRNDFVAGKIVLGRKKIEESGAKNVYELLKSEPSVTISVNGRLGLMGLPGYTQFLIDGVAPPPGRSPVEVDTVHVERIEIVKSAVAEFGPYGTAGTINVVTRKTNRKSVSQLRVGASGGASENGANIAWSTNQFEVGSPLSLSAQVSASQVNKQENSTVEVTRKLAGLPAREQRRSQVHVPGRSSRLLASASIGWQLDAHNKITVEPSLLTIDSTAYTEEQNLWTSPTSGPLHASSRAGSRLSSIGLPIKWVLKPDSHTQLRVTLSPTRFRLSRVTDREDEVSTQESISRSASQQSDRSADFIKLDYSSAFGGGHAVKVGATLGWNGERSDFLYLLDDSPDPSLQALGTRRHVQDRKRSFFLQDEWRVSDTLAFNVGVTDEWREIRVEEGIHNNSLQYEVLAPSTHLAWKTAPDGKDQFRIGLARTFNAPFGDQLSIRPVINPMAPCPATSSCGRNSIEYADKVGNQSLKPERSLGANISYEHYIGDDSLVSLEVFSRQLTDVIGTEIQLEDVAWSAVPRYVARPVNLGTAWSRGISAEAQLQVQEFWKSGPKLDVSGSVNLARSAISTIPGPDNRLSGQARWSAKLGGNYVFRDLPLKLSLDANWAPSGWVRSSATQRLYSARQFDLSMGGAWTFKQGLRVVVNANNMQRNTITSIDEFTTEDGTISRKTTRAEHVRISARLEKKL